MSDAPYPEPKKYSDCAIRLCDSELIQKNLLIALSDESKVAIILDKRDLQDLIGALALSGGDTNHKSLEHDLRQLYKSAFGEPLEF